MFTPSFAAAFRCLLFRVLPLNQCGPLDIEIISEEFKVMLRQLSYAIKNQLKAPKATTRGFLVFRWFFKA